MSAGEKRTFALQLGLQLLVLIVELPMLQEEFLIHLGQGIGAKLERGNISSICKDSCQVIFTQPSTNYSTRISGTRDGVYLF